MTAIASFPQLPLSFAERLALPGDIRVPATLEEYLDFAEQCEYRVEYSQNQIVSMSTPSQPHETIIINFGWILNNLFSEEEPYTVLGSNLGVYIPAANAHYKPDNVVFKNDPEYILHKVRKRSLKSLVNPFAVAEVFSDGTMHYDMTEKLPNYKQCPSLEYIIYIYQHKPFVTLFTRTEDPLVWLNRDFSGLDAAFLFEGQDVLLRQLYRKVRFANGKKYS